MRACWISSATQSLMVVYVPLLFLHFQKEFGITLSQLGILIVMNFGTQFVMDLFAAHYAERIGIRLCLVMSNAMVVAGFLGLAILPSLMPPFAGLCISSVLYGVGGGLVEVIVSPLVEACPSDNKVASMAFLHSLYGLGCIVIILASTLFFTLFGLERWRWLTLLWLLVPLCNMFNYMRVPLPPSMSGGQAGLTVGQLIRMPIFWLMIGLMMLGGSIEVAMAQWSSAFTEGTLGVSKSVGDLFGACFFATLLFVSRTLYGRLTIRFDLNSIMLGSSLIGIAGFVMVAFSPWAWLSMLGLGLSGLSVGVVWPGTLSLSAQRIPNGGTAMFGLCALGGDIGCTLGPAIMGWIAAAFGGNLRAGMCAGLGYATLLFLGLLLLKKVGRRKRYGL